MKKKNENIMLDSWFMGIILSNNREEGNVSIKINSKEDHERLNDIIEKEDMRLTNHFFPTNFSYRGFKFNISRHPRGGFLNFYIYIPKKYHIKTFVRETFFHGGVSVACGRVVGYDCNHFLDYSPYDEEKWMKIRKDDYEYSGDCYRTLTYILNCIKDGIDRWLGGDPSKHTIKCRKTKHSLMYNPVYWKKKFRKI